MKYINLLCVLLAVFSLTGNAESTPAPKKTAHKPPPAKKAAPPADTSDEPNVWTPDPKMLPQLQAEQTFGPYTMRIPIGYTVKHEDLNTNKANIATYEIDSPKRKDGTSAPIIISVARSQPGYTTNTLEKLLDLNKWLVDAPGVVKSNMELGEVNDISVARQYYKSPPDKTDPTTSHAFQYVISEGTSFVILAALDAEPYSTDTLPLCEAAARTLRKTN